jgi:hypothetical protein
LFTASLVLLIPCFWQRHIEAGDLASHLYNAWLVELVRQGKAAGLWVTDQWTNVLFDWLLSFLFRIFGANAAEHIALPICVLIFFWGVFALVATVNRRAPWTLMPCFAILAYGLMFRAGFFNYYLSLAFSIFFLAIAWKGHRGDWIGAIGMLAMALLAHPFAAAWIVAGAIYISIARRISQRAQCALMALAITAVFGTRELAMHAYTSVWTASQALSMTGAHQTTDTGWAGRSIAAALFLFWTVMLLWRNGERGRIVRGIPAQLYCVAAACALILPNTIIFSPPANNGFYFISWRMSLISAALACVLLGGVNPRRWHAVGFSLIAAAFFCSAYAEERTINHAEKEVSALVHTLPPGQRVFFVADEKLISQNRIGWTEDHILDRACIGHCFSFANYEAASGIFRLHAAPGNGIVVSNALDSEAMWAGEYAIKPEDIPIFQVYPCRREGMDFCTRSLGVGERNGSTPAGGH